MQAFVSLHTAAPHSQLDHEVSYAGYKRMPVDFDDEFGSKPLNVVFPFIQADSDDVLHYTAIGKFERGQGEIFMRIPTMPMELKDSPERRTREFWIKQKAPEAEIDNCIREYGYTAPRVVICNTAPVALPIDLHPIARAAHKLVFSGLMAESDLHPKLFEAINDELARAGVPILQVKREATATMNVKMSQMKSLREMM
jgi:hypothetical protein